MKFTITFAKTQCELQLNQKECEKALQEFRRFFEKKFQSTTDEGKMAGGRMLKVNEANNNNNVANGNDDDVSLIHISQYFDLQRIAVWLARNNNGDPSQRCQVDGILLSRLVKVINKRKIFGQHHYDVNFDKFIFEIYDHFFEDFCVLTNSNYPIPADSVIRIKFNTIKDDFSYRGVSNRTGNAPAAAGQQQLLFGSPSGFRPAKTVRFEDQTTNRIKLSSPAVPRESYLGLTEQEITLARAMIDLLYQNRTLYDAVKGQIDKFGKPLSKRRIGQMFWNRFRDELINQTRKYGLGGEGPGTSLEKIDRFQPLFHEIVCRRYLDMLKLMNGSYSQACQTYVLFNTIHAKILSIMTRVEQLDPEYEINYHQEENFICPTKFQCCTTLETIKQARDNFRKKYDAILNLKSKK